MEANLPEKVCVSGNMPLSIDNPNAKYGYLPIVYSTSDKIGLELKSVKVGLRSLISFKTTVTA